MRKKILVLAAILGVFSLAAFIPKVDDPIDKLVAALQQLTDKNPIEKIYLHMDKPYYAIGDTMWFKGYVTIGSRHQLSALSGSVYVDLITDHDSTIRTLKLPVTSGMVMGNLTFDDDFREGNYRIRAYTQWMRNAGEEFFYDRTITVGNIVSSGVIAKATYSYKTSGSGKNTLLANMNFSTDRGLPIGNQQVRYQIVIRRKVVWNATANTDASGNLSLEIPGADKANLNGGYIRTYIQNADKESVMKEMPIKAVLLSQSDVQFFPESGNLVNGVTSKVGFTALGMDGAGKDVKGSIVDNTGAEVSTFESLHAGMGSFNLRPEAGKTYTAKATFGDGSVKTVALPKVLNDGYVLSVYQPNQDSILIRVSASANKVLSKERVALMVQSNGEVAMASTMGIDGPVTSIWMPKADLPSGIAQFTLFDAANQPLAERIAFIKNKDNMTLDVKSAKASYKSKQPVQISLNAVDSKGKPTFGNFSVSVIDEGKVPVNEAQESTIFNHLLLTSDLRGYIEQPNYYFSGADGVDKALDNLMLTQGYRKFVWKDLPAQINAKPRFEAEGLGMTISGTVRTLGNKPLPGAGVSFVSVRAKVNLQTTTDADGRFKFDKIFVTDSINFTVQALNAKGKDRVMLSLDTIPRLRLMPNRNLADVSTNINGTLKAYIDNGKKQDDLYERLGMLDRVQRLREVRINAKRKATNSNMAPQGILRINSISADQTIVVDPEEAARYQTLGQYLQGKVAGVHFVMGPQAKIMEPRGGTLGLILNGRNLSNADEISEVLDGSVQPEDVLKVDVVRTNRAMVSFLGGGAILVYTKNTYFRRPNIFNVLNIKPKGFNKVREFYSPKYTNESDHTQPDLRSTIYWSPYLKTDASGQATISFFNADGPGTYRVLVEGINAEGELGRALYRYKVER